MNFKNAIVRRPCRAMTKGISSAGLGTPEIENALRQHDGYIKALESCGLRVTVLEADERYPDSVFVEDTAVVAEKCAVITYPGAASRQGEEVVIREALKNFYDQKDINVITVPGTLDGGDVMQVKNHFYVGMSDRTNREGVEQFTGMLAPYGYTVSAVEMKEFLHLKTGVNSLENNNLLVSGEFVGNSIFGGYNQTVVDEAEAYAANSLWLNGTVLVPLGFPKTRKAVEVLGYPVLDVDVSEFRKLDGGLSCLSLRF